MENNAASAELDYEAMNDWVDRRLEQKIKEHEENKTPRLALISTKGTMDMAYPPFILASTAAAMGWEGSVLYYILWSWVIKKRFRHRGVATW